MASKSNQSDAEQAYNFPKVGGGSPWGDPPVSPVSLPSREFMDTALELWKKLELPSLHLKEPWFGYSLGYWTEEDHMEARLATEGRYFETGEKHRLTQRIPIAK